MPYPPFAAAALPVESLGAPDVRAEPVFAAGLCVGYLLAGDGAGEADKVALRRAGCATIRTESSAEGRTLLATLAFLAQGDRLVLPSVRHIPGPFGGLERLLRELDARGADALLLAERLSTGGEQGRLLRRAVLAVAELQVTARRPRPTAAIRAQARAMAASGAAPGAIAQALRVSRMTVWRWLKSA